MPFMNPVAVDNPYYALGEMRRLAHGISGHLIDEGERGVCIPTIHSEQAGKGHAGRFIDELKERYSTVRFPNIMNPILEGMLTRRGFKKKREYVPSLKAHVEVYIWRKK